MFWIAARVESFLAFRCIRASRSIGDIRKYRVNRRVACNGTLPLTVQTESFLVRPQSCSERCLGLTERHQPGKLHP